MEVSHKAHKQGRLTLRRASSSESQALLHAHSPSPLSFTTHILPAPQYTPRHPSEPGGRKGAVWESLCTCS
ncbi:hypothetical protein E2C01_021613 [Portunus trituberculatus]|uniref:Uncharacterized protein n=1 Tax=Portunus trituberculatus TaxID=210409 RepID=A0A5B7E4R2_PORTR|nr:hypothetical protein [Portunus trituberculatus]